MQEQKLLKKKNRARDDNDLNQLAIACHNLGEYYHEQADYENALKSFEEEAAAYKSNGSSNIHLGKAHRMIGEMYMLLGDFDKALKHEQIYLECSKMEQNTIEEQRAYATIGRVYLLHGQSLSEPDESTPQIRKAEKSFLKSLLVCKSLRGLSKLDIVDMEARLYLNLSVVKENLNDYEDCIQFMEKALTLCRKNELFELLHQCYVTAALFYHIRQNENTKALRFLNLALEVAERLPNKVVKMCEALIAKSDIFIKTGDFQSAKQVLHKAYKMKTTNQDDRETVEKRLRIVAAICYTEDALIALDTNDFVTKKKLYEKMGDGACSLKNYDKAIDYYLKMLEMAENCSNNGECHRKDLIPGYVSLYQTYIDLKKYDDALLYLRKEQVLNKDDPKENISTLINIADVYDLSGLGFWEIENVYQEARVEAQKLQDLRLQKTIGIKQIALRKKHKMNTLAEILADELRMTGIDVNDEHVDDEDDKSDIDGSSDLEKNTPDIGEDISLSEISGSDCDEEKANISGTRTRRKRGQAFTVKRNEKGETQLHQACISGNVQQVIRLLDQGHAVNVRDNAGWMPLHEASNHGYPDIVKVLIERGAAINDKGGKSCDGITALHDACVNGCLEVVEVLLDHGAQPTLRTDFNDTALDSLEKWRETVTLDQTEEAFYEDVKKRIVKMLDTAGCVEVSPMKSISKRNEKDSSDSIRSKRSRIGVLRNSAFVYSDSDDEVEKVNKPETVDDIINKEFPPVSTENEFDERNEYRTVIDNMRKGNKIPLVSSVICETEVKRKPGLLAEDEVGERWLDEDVQMKKKRKVSSISRNFSSHDLSNMSPLKTLSKSKMNCDHADRSKENIAVDLFEPMELYNIDDNSLDAFDVLMNNATTSSSLSHRKRRLSSVDSRHNSKSLTKQPTLLTNGFTKVTHTPSNQDENTNFNPVKISPRQSSPLKSKMASIKVKVEDHSLNVPVNNVEDLTVGWLAEEAARRYYNLKGLRPVLRLMTEDGAIFENDDPISVTFGETIASTVLDWQLPHISKRYMEVCQQLKTEPLECIQSTLELIQATQELQITDQSLDRQMVQPLLKAIQHQSNLESIDLSNNFLEDECLKLLATILPTLPRLKHLRLAGNHITRDGITNLASVASDSFPDLESLDLSYNPLSNQSIPSLNILLTKAKNLKKLCFCATEMTELPDPSSESFKYSQMTDVDFSFNPIKLQYLNKILRKLNSCRMVSLNLAYSCSDRGVMESIVAFLNAGTCEKLRYLNLSGLDFEDGDVWMLLQALERTKNLDTLRLMENPRLSSITLKLLLERLNVTRLELDGCWKLYSKIGDNVFVSGQSSISIIRMTVNPISKMDDLEWINAIWTRMFGDRANIKVRHNCVELTVHER